MSFKIDRGLFKFDFTDHHAVLCVPVDADTKEVRKRYLQIARRLHPDSCASASPAEKQLASELLSKLVNPAYEKLSADRNRAEYNLLLSQMGKRLVQESATVEIKTDVARELASAPNVDRVYKTALLKVAQTQYSSLEEVLQVIGQVSELNLVYLMRTAGRGIAAPPPPPAVPKPPVAGTPTSPPGQAPTAGSPPAAATSQQVSPPGHSVIAANVSRAQILISKGQFAQAGIELREALKVAPNNSVCHSMMGYVYFKQNQLKMAKVHFERALALNPNEEMARKGKRAVEVAMGQQPSTPSSAAPKTGAAKQPDKSGKSGGGGLFGGLFGGKKK